MKGGGITINPLLNLNPEEAFNYYIHRSTNTLLSIGGSGIILNLTLNAGIESPYVSFNCDKLTQPVTALIIKISVLTERQPYQYNLGGNTINTMIIEDFEREIKIQQDIVNKTINYLNPIAPSIVYANLVENTIIDLFIKDLTNVLPEIRKRFGLIAMESMDNMSPVYKLLKCSEPFNSHRLPPAFESDKLKKKYIAFYIYKLIQLGIVGYVHGDYHTNNILSNNDGTQMSLIDFGRSEEINETHARHISELFNIFINTREINNLKQLTELIYRFNSPIFQGLREQDIVVFYSWFNDETILRLVLPELLDICRSEQHKNQITQSVIISLVENNFPFKKKKIVKNNLSIKFVNSLIAGMKRNAEISKRRKARLKKAIENMKLAKLLAREQSLLKESLLEQDKIIEGGAVSNQQKSLQIIRQEVEQLPKIKINQEINETFQDWRNTIYNIYINPDIKERNAYYQEQTPFTILTHIMVCCGLFGPLESEMYIDSDDKDISKQLNSIADAFVTMNQGYLSMSQLQRIIQDAKTKKASISDPSIDVSMEEVITENYGKETIPLALEQGLNQGIEVGGAKRKSKRGKTCKRIKIYKKIRKSRKIRKGKTYKKRKY